MQQLLGADESRHPGAGRHRRASRRHAETQLSEERRALGVAEAQEIVLRDVERLGHETIDLRGAVGRVLAEDVKSPLALPPWDNSSMDGYAVRSQDVRGASNADPVALRVVATIGAGERSSLTVGERQAIRIMTGAPIPAGADTVIRVEDTDAGSTTVRIRSDRDVLRNIRPRGEDLAQGAVVASAGEQLSPGHVGGLASVGRGRIRVIRRPRVAILASGDELVDVDRFDEVMAGNRIVTSNSYSLDAAVREAGAESISLGTVGDDPKAIREKLSDCECDLLVTTGGVSVGEFDYTRSVVAELGATQRFWRVKIRPGAPVSYGVLKGRPWLGLPGNPVSTLVTFELFARPAIRKMQGQRLLFRRPVDVQLSEAVTIAAPLTHFLRAIVSRVGAGYSAKLTGPQGSGLLSSMARANALLIIPPDRTRLERGQVVDAILLREDTGYIAEAPVK